MSQQKIFKLGHVVLYNQDVSRLYKEWPTPDVIISDGGYGVSGFKGELVIGMPENHEFYLFCFDTEVPLSACQRAPFPV